MRRNTLVLWIVLALILTSGCGGGKRRQEAEQLPTAPSAAATRAVPRPTSTSVARAATPMPAYRQNLDIAAQCSWVLPIFGVHPWNAPEYVARLEELHEAIAASPLLGEIGLDYYYVVERSEYPAQRAVFEFFLAAARQQGKVVQLHTKGAEALDLLRRYGIQRTVVHWYSGPLDTFRELLAFGAYFTVGPELLYSDHIRAIVRELPLERLLTETDNPGGPRSLTGKPGTPALIQEVVQGLADLGNTSAAAIEAAVQDNLARLVGDDVRLPGA